MEHEPIDLSDQLQAYPGKWVALSQGRVIMAADTPYALIMDLHSKGLMDMHAKQPRDVTIVRAPDVGEALLVGLG